MNHLIIIGHPDKNSFCYNGIFKKIKEEMSKNNQTYKIIDLYSDDFTRPREKLIDNYKKLITWSDSIYIISPVWWFRLTPRTEIFFDEVFTPGFALPVLTLYVNSVKLRLVMGVYSFVFGWKLSLFTKTKQFWSVPFVSAKKREKYLKVVEKDIRRDINLIKI